MVSMSSVKSIRGDRSMGVLTLALMIAVIVYNTLKDGAFPWLDGHYDDGKPSSFNSGFATYCSNYKNEWSKYRCCKFLVLYDFTHSDCNYTDIFC